MAASRGIEETALILRRHCNTFVIGSRLERLFTLMTPKEETKLNIKLTGAHHDYSKGLNSYAFFKVSNRTIGEDLVQDTFMKTWRYLVRGGEIEIMKAFLYHILNDLIVDEYRKHKTTSLDIILEKGLEPNTGHSEHLSNILDGKAAFLLIPFLPEKYGKVIKMRYVQDLSLEEISLITGQSRNTIAVQAHRGLEKLKILYNLAEEKNSSQPIPQGKGEGSSPELK